MDDRLAFLVEWFDPTASLIKQFQLLYYPHDSGVEMFDVKNRRPFLRRTKCDSLKLHDLYVGANVNVFSRQLNVVDFGDEYTKKKLSSQTEKTLGMVKPASYDNLGTILEMISANKMNVINMKTVNLSRAEASKFYAEHQYKPFFGQLVEMMSSGPAAILEIMGENAIDNWRNLMGPTDPNRAKDIAPQSIRARFGRDVTNNAVHGSDSPDSARRELNFFFGPERLSGSVLGAPSTALLRNSTLCVIKPHAVTRGDTGKILAFIKERGGFEISASQMFHLDRVNAEEFLEVYKGVVAEYPGMVNELTSGPCMALEITSPKFSNSEEVQQAFREFVGPADPEIARHLRPHTLRANFGEDKIKNAVHCTDLPDDSDLEVQYFFQILEK